MVPTAGLRTATWVPGTSAHTWQAVAAGGMSIGMKGMMIAAKTISLTSIDLYNYPYYWEAHEAWEGLWIASVRNSSEHRFLQGLIKCGAALLKIRMAKYEIQDLIGARNLARSGIDLLSKVGTDQFMGLDIPPFLKFYQNFVNPIYDNKIHVIDRKTPRIELTI